MSLTGLFHLQGPEPLCGPQHVETLMFHKHDYKLEIELFLLLVQLCGTTCRPMSRHQRHWQCSRVASRLQSCLLYLKFTELLQLLYIWRC